MGGDGSIDGVAAMTDLEERLKGEGGAALRSAILSRLTQLDGDLGLRIASGLRPEDFVRGSAMKAAVSTARSILSAMRSPERRREDERHG